VTTETRLTSVYNKHVADRTRRRSPFIVYYALLHSNVRRRWNVYTHRSAVCHRNPHSASTGRTVFSQLTAAVVRHKANDGVAYAIRAWFKYDTALSAVV